MARKPVGWRGDSWRHELAAKGIKTAPSHQRTIAANPPPLTEVWWKCKGDGHQFLERLTTQTPKSKVVERGTTCSWCNGADLIVSKVIVGSQGIPGPEGE